MYTTSSFNYNTLSLTGIVVTTYLQAIIQQFPVSIRHLLPLIQDQKVHKVIIELALMIMKNSRQP